MIIGIGHDITELSRIEKVINGASGDRFLRRILTEQEYDTLLSTVGQQRKVEYVAGRFAVKESVSKAFGCGIGRLLGFQDMNVTRSDSGKPNCIISKASLDKLGYSHDQLNVHVSITHERKLASAFAVIEKL